MWKRVLYTVSGLESLKKGAVFPKNLWKTKVCSKISVVEDHFADVKTEDKQNTSYLASTVVYLAYIHTHTHVHNHTYIFTHKDAIYTRREVCYMAIEHYCSGKEEIKCL